MNAINLAPALSTIEANPTFLFTSPHRSIRAYGVAERICLSASGAAHSDSFLQTAVQAAIDRARKAGQANPIVAGAIPFDIRQPCSLFVPMAYTVFARESLLVEDTRSERAPTVLGMRSLPDKGGYKDAVSRAIASFRVGKMSKAVLSRILEIELAQPVDVAAILNALVKQNPGGYHFKAPLGDGAILLGASPELLIRKDGASIHTNPLAGSTKRRSDPDEDQLASRTLLQSNKDNFEHSLVVHEIQEALAPVCKALRTPAEPALMNTSTMWHLSTLITGELEDQQTSALQLACRLHPTPAVCGYPTAESRSLIGDLESFDRGIFSGAVGWCDSEGNGEWAVAIRCGTVRDKTIRLFAGAGIVEASDPESEWAETEAKLGTMLRAFGIETGQPICQ
ncbi:isochorismate synthase [Methylocystis sp. B8]|uniref:isochorismate synthase n=1 Tax=Methylocystis sp. B8 TaxID=544938 RepID=UPI0010FE1317|nr:isochorismate synthase [Methylocystis sp. B8]TLG75098.1 isochorismate synthase [Methylocystis sp. B8]